VRFVIVTVSSYSIDRYRACSELLRATEFRAEPGNLPFSTEYSLFLWSLIKQTFIDVVTIHPLPDICGQAAQIGGNSENLITSPYCSL